jgi:hypothetical protein
MEGAPIFVKVMAKGAKKPRECQGCSFQKWCIGDTCFIVSTKIPGELNWLCCDCAIKRGLPVVHHRKNRSVLPLAVEEGWISMTWRDLTSGYFCSSQGVAPAPAHDISIKRS